MKNTNTVQLASDEIMIASQLGSTVYLLGVSNPKLRSKYAPLL